MIPWAHPAQKPKQHVDWLNRFCRANCRVSLYFTTSCPVPWRDLDRIWCMVPWAQLSLQPEWKLKWFIHLCRAQYC